MERITWKNYWYEYDLRLAKDRVDICLATKDPLKYCNGYFKYSAKDPGSGREFVITDTNDPDCNILKRNKTIDATKIIGKQKYLGGYHGDTYGYRKYEITLTHKDDKSFKEIAYKEINTPRVGGPYGQWGTGVISFYFEDNPDGKTFDTPIALLKSRYTVTNTKP